MNVCLDRFIQKVGPELYLATGLQRVINLEQAAVSCPLLEIAGIGVTVVDTGTVQA